MSTIKQKLCNKIGICETNLKNNIIFYENFHQNFNINMIFNNSGFCNA